MTQSGTTTNTVIQVHSVTTFYAFVWADQPVYVSHNLGGTYSRSHGITSTWDRYDTEVNQTTSYTSTEILFKRRLGPTKRTAHAVRKNSAHVVGGPEKRPGSVGTRKVLLLEQMPRPCQPRVEQTAKLRLTLNRPRRHPTNERKNKMAGYTYSFRSLN